MARRTFSSKCKRMQGFQKQSHLLLIKLVLRLPSNGITVNGSLSFHYDLSWQLTDCFWRWERLLERKGIRGLSVGTQVCQTLLCLLDTGNVTGGNPPEGQVGAIEGLKPLTALLHHLTVPALVDKGREIGEAGPQREVHENEIVLKRTQGRGVSFWRLQSPEKAGAGVGECVNRIQLCHKLGHQWISEGSQHTGDVHLSKLIHHLVPFLRSLTIDNSPPCCACIPTGRGERVSSRSETTFRCIVFDCESFFRPMVCIWGSLYRGEEVSTTLTHRKTTAQLLYEA